MLMPSEADGHARLSDAELVGRALRGDVQAFAILVDRYRPRAYRLALKVLGRHEDAEDATQESLAAAFLHLDECGRPECFAGWLMTIVRNRSLNLLRRESIRTTQELPSQLPCASTAPPDRAAEEDELRQVVSNTLAGIPEVRRRIFLMHDVEGCSHAEIAAALDIKAGTVRSHLWHARAALRGALDPVR